LMLGSACLTGDPTYASTGNITITSNISAAEDLTIIAGGDITANPSVTSLSTANSSPSTGAASATPPTDITLIAGAKVTINGGGNPATNIPGDGAIGTGSVTVDFSSGTGGSIKCSTVTVDTSSNTQLTANGQFPQPNGGNVTLVAYGNNANA